MTKYNKAIIGGLIDSLISETQRFAECKSGYYADDPFFPIEKLNEQAYHFNRARENLEEYLGKVVV